MISRPSNNAHNPRRPLKAAGVVLFWLLSVYSGLNWADPQDLTALPPQCVVGFSPPEIKAPAEIIVQQGNGERVDALINPEMQHWLSAHQWQASYQLWQQSRRCKPGNNIAGCAPAEALPLASEGICAGPKDGFEFLAMHRYLLQSQRALWPSLSEQLSPWKTFPSPEDYPAFVQAQVHAWPDALRRAAAVIDRLPKLKRAQILTRWPSEGAFGQWLQCGTNQGGLAVDALYSALLSNGTSGSFSGAEAGIRQAQSPLDLYVFWRTHAWIDKAWDAYRKALGKTPDDPQLQAALIEQCQSQTRRVEQATQLKPAALPSQLVAQSALFIQGELNPAFTGRWVKLLGEVDAITQGDDGRVYFKLNLRLVGVNPIWMTSEVNVAPDSLKLGDRYWLVGSVYKTTHLDSNGKIPSDYLLLTTSIQSVK